MSKSTMTLAEYNELSGGGKPKRPKKAKKKRRPAKAKAARPVIDKAEAFKAMIERVAPDLLKGSERECSFAREIGRRWRFDMAWPRHRIAAEIHGGVWAQGRHTRGAGFIADREKMNAAVLLGWRVLEYPAEQIKKNPAGMIDDVRSLIAEERFII